MRFEFLVSVETTIWIFGSYRFLLLQRIARSLDRFGLMLWYTSEVYLRERQLISHQ